MTLIVLLVISGCKDKFDIVEPSGKTERTNLIRESMQKGYELMENKSKQIELIKNKSIKQEKSIKELKNKSIEKINLTIKNIYWSTMYPEINEAVDLTIKVENKGSNVNNFSYSIVVYKNSTQWKKGEYNLDLKTGKEKIIDVGFKFNKSGEYKAEVAIGNESAAKTVYVKKQDENKTTENTKYNKNAGNVIVEGCNDTDGGYKTRTKGRCTDNSTYQYGISDFCVSNTELREVFCNDEGKCEMMAEICSCIDGACS